MPDGRNFCVECGSIEVDGSCLCDKEVINMNKFWMVWHNGDRSPKVMHASYDKAESEARRLAVCNAGRFYVLEALVVVERSEVIVSSLKG